MNLLNLNTIYLFIPSLMCFTVMSDILTLLYSTMLLMGSTSDNYRIQFHACTQTETHTYTLMHKIT